MIPSPRIGVLRSYWKVQRGVDLDPLVHPIFLKIVGAYLDEINIRNSGLSNKNGFVQFIRDLEQHSWGGFFKSKRVLSLIKDPHTTIEQLLNLLVGSEEYFEQYLFDQQFVHPGWSGIVVATEDDPEMFGEQRSNIVLKELIFVELLFEIDALDQRFGNSWLPITTDMDVGPIPLFDPVPRYELNELLKIWQIAYEWTLYNRSLKTIRQNRNDIKRLQTGNNFQALFCMDDRSASFRRELESVDIQCQTYGLAGNFGVPDQIVSAKKKPGKGLSTPLLERVEQNLKVAPNGLIKEIFLSVFVGYFALTQLLKSALFGAVSGNDLLLEEIQASERVGKQFSLLDIPLQDRVNMVAGVMNNIGLRSNFAPVIYVVGHTSSNILDPFRGALGCGACNGRSGERNARIFARIANDHEVRKQLEQEGIRIPSATQFLAVIHDTNLQKVRFIDERKLNAANTYSHELHVNTFNEALNRVAVTEKMFIKNKPVYGDQDMKSPQITGEEEDYNLGHASNYMWIIGSKYLVPGVSLDNRAFLSSYSSRHDADGKQLGDLLQKAFAISTSINLEYYFSTVDPERFGSGSDLSHTRISNLGMVNGIDGDLRTGLPKRITKWHEPVRLMMLIEHDPDTVLKVLGQLPALRSLLDNEWVHLLVMENGSHDYYRYDQQAFHAYDLTVTPISSMNQVFMDSPQTTLQD
ncbi:MAG: DUF2309 family protein [Pedobacter sp.]|nr:MAG: DUF2309 family protein [Pedobacter sp.]